MSVSFAIPFFLLVLSGIFVGLELAPRGPRRAIASQAVCSAVGVFLANLAAALVPYGFRYYSPEYGIFVSLPSWMAALAALVVTHRLAVSRSGKVQVLISAVVGAMMGAVATSIVGGGHHLVLLCALIALAVSLRGVLRAPFGINEAAAAEGGRALPN